MNIHAKIQLRHGMADAHKITCTNKLRVDSIQRTSFSC